MGEDGILYIFDVTSGQLESVLPLTEGAREARSFMLPYSVCTYFLIKRFI